MKILNLFFACVALPNFAIVGASFNSRYNQREYLGGNINRAEEHRPINLPSGSRITIWKTIDGSIAPNDIVKGVLGQAPTDQSSSSAGTQHGQIDIYRGATRLWSVMVRGDSHYVDREHNTDASTRYVCSVQARDSRGLFFLGGTLTHAVQHRQWDAEVMHAYFVDKENVHFEGELVINK